uniref:Uncharacterized protein n=1 Tax=Oryza sativa subsp. japonica TaxID=39947 RepID=Q75LW4_ORYSJ|nr:hypothetical protein Os03g42680 [Oryza sativa Japonica Group]
MDGRGATSWAWIGCAVAAAWTGCGTAIDAACPLVLCLLGLNQGRRRGTDVVGNANVAIVSCQKCLAVGRRRPTALHAQQPAAVEQSVNTIRFLAVDAVDASSALAAQPISLAAAPRPPV